MNSEEKLLSRDNSPGGEINPQERSGLVGFILCLGDITGAYLSFSMAIWIRELLIPWMGGRGGWSIENAFFIIGLISILLLFAFSNLYPGFGLAALKELELVFNALSLVYGFFK